MSQQLRRAKRIVCPSEEKDPLSPSATCNAAFDDHALPNTTILQPSALANVETAAMGLDETKETQENLAALSSSDIQADITFSALQSLPKAAESVFDLFADNFPVQQDRLPYSWMILNPGQIPAVLIGPQFATLYNEAGETRMEEAIRQCIKEPNDYYFTATSFKFIMSIRCCGYITEQATVAIMRRLFSVHKSPQLWEAYRDNFIPGQFKFELYEPRSHKRVSSPAIQTLLEHLLQHQNEMRPCRNALGKILSVLVTGNDYQSPGRLYYKNSGQPVAEDRLAIDMVGLSKIFMCRKGQKWPFNNVSVKTADKYGLQAVIALMQS